MCVPPQNSLNSSPKNCRGSVCHFPLNLAVDLAAVEVLASPERNGCGICGVPAKARESRPVFVSLGIPAGVIPAIPREGVVLLPTLLFWARLYIMSSNHKMPKPPIMGVFWFRETFWWEIWPEVMNVALCVLQLELGDMLGD